MVKYFYDKYNLIVNRTYTDDSEWESQGYANTYFDYNPKSYTFDKKLNVYKGGASRWESGERWDYGAVAYVISPDGAAVTRLLARTSGLVGSLIECNRHIKYAEKNTFNETYARGTLNQSNIVAENGTYPNDGRHSDGFWYVRKGIANTAPTIKATIPTQSVKKNTPTTLNLANYFSDAEGDPLTFTATSSNTNIATTAVSGNTLTLTGKTIGSVTITVTASDGKLTVSQSFTLNVTNTAPTITVSAPANNVTLYENDVFGVAGNVTDIDVGNVVSVKYSVDGGAPQAITAIVSNGSASSFAKNLTYKNGALYDGATAITGQLAEGSQHTLNIWAEDDKGGKSPEIIRTFYVVPNRAASLTLDAFITRTGLINTDVVNVSGAVADLDNGNVIVKYKIGNGAFVQVYNGQASSTPTPFNFNILLADLADGANQITIQAVDAYNAITQLVLSLTKTANEQPLLNAVTYYEITPPNGATDGLQLYIERELGDLVVSADIFMGANGETEVFVPMTLVSTANLTNGNVEDTFSYQHSTDATKTVIRINMSRASAATNKAIKKISGVLT